MKSMLLTILVFSLLGNNSIFQKKELDTILFQKSSVLGIKKGTSYDKLKKKFPQPDSIKYFYDSLLNPDSTTRLFFGNSYFDIKNKKVKAFLIRDSKYPLEYKNIVVGMSKKKIKEIFPESYKNMYYPIDDKTGFVSVLLKKDGIVLDSQIKFRIKDGKLIAFGYWEPM